MHTELPLSKDRGFAATLGNDAAIGSEGIGHYFTCTVRSSIVGSKVAPNEPKSKPN
jgi:hypothetical protein